MPPHHQQALPHEELKRQLIRSCAALGIAPVLVPEPEVLQRDLDRIQCKTLAKVIATLLAENEPLLTAEHDGATVTVREVGGDGVFKVTVEAVL